MHNGKGGRLGVSKPTTCGRRCRSAPTHRRRHTKSAPAVRKRGGDDGKAPSPPGPPGGVVGDPTKPPHPRCIERPAGVQADPRRHPDSTSKRKSPEPTLRTFPTRARRSRSRDNVGNDRVASQAATAAERDPRVPSPRRGLFSSTPMPVSRSNPTVRPVRSKSASAARAASTPALPKPAPPASASVRERAARSGSASARASTGVCLCARWGPTPQGAPAGSAEHLAASTSCRVTCLRFGCVSVPLALSTGPKLRSRTRRPDPLGTASFGFIALTSASGATLARLRSDTCGLPWAQFCSRRMANVTDAGPHMFPSASCSIACARPPPRNRDHRQAAQVRMDTTTERLQATCCTQAAIGSRR